MIGVSLSFPGSKIREDSLQNTRFMNEYLSSKGKTGRYLGYYLMVIDGKIVLILNHLFSAILVYSISSNFLIRWVGARHDDKNLDLL